MAANQIVTLIFFLATNVLVAFPFRVPVPGALVKGIRHLLATLRTISISTKRPPSLHIRIDFLTAPVVAVLLLLASGTISGEVIRNGIIGSDGINPADIMVLFISLAYIALSLDTTGLFRFLALWVAVKGGSSGRRLFILLFLFFLATGLFVGNDPVILSGTPFLAYFSRAIDIPPTAWIFSQFTACNMASAVLISSNPTNLVLAGAFSLSFVQYTSNVIVPVVISSLFVLPILLILFRSPSSVPPLIPTIDVKPSSALVDKHGALFGTALLLATLGVLVGTNVIHVPVWMITAPPAIIMLIRDALHDLRRRPNKPAEVVEMPSIAPKDARSPSPIEPTSKPPWTLSRPLGQASAWLHHTFPTVLTVIKQLPLSLLPFAFSMFILVQALVTTGWITIFAGWWTTIADRGGVVGAIVCMSAFSCILCNACGTNIGATILLARVLQVWIDSSAPNPRVKNGAIFALALGSNYGAFTLSFSASLAGMLWRSILHDKRIKVGRLQFALLNTPVVAVAMGVAAAVLIAQMYITQSA